MESRVSDVGNWLCELHRLLTEPIDDVQTFALTCIDIGRRLLELPTGLLSHVEGQGYRVLQAQSGLAWLRPGIRSALGDTYCASAIERGSTISAHDVGASPTLAASTAHAALGWQAYIGTPVRVEGEVFGTLSFSDPDRTGRPFAPNAIRGVEFMAALLGRFIERQGAMARLVDRQRMLAQSFLSSPMGTAISAPSGEILEVNRAFCHLLGWRECDILHRTAADFTHPEDRELTTELYRELFSGQRDRFDIEKRYIHANGQPVEVEVGAGVVRDSHGAPLYVTIQAVDLSERNRVRRELQAANSALRQLASTDSLTGLLNRRALDEVLLREFSRAKRHGAVFSLMLVDLDHFKAINDRHGHPVGDAVLAGLGVLLREVVRASDVAARLGGEEFAVVLPDTSLVEASTLAERVRHAVHKSAWPVSGVTASFGVAQLDAEANDPGTVLKRADRALYDAKAAGRDRVMSHPAAPWVAEPPPERLH